MIGLNSHKTRCDIFWPIAGMSHAKVAARGTLPWLACALAQWVTPDCNTQCPQCVARISHPSFQGSLRR
jgi:hypothetical protein